MPSQIPQLTQNIQDQFSNARSSVGWPKQLFTFALVILVSILFIYAGLAFGYKAFLNNEIEKADSALQELSSRVTEEEKESLAVLNSQLTNIRTLLREHTFTSQGFALLESLTHPNISYTEMDLVMEDGKISLGGIANSYDDLVAQLTILEESQYVISYNLEDSQWNNGVIQFNLDMFVTDKVFELINT
ncbi:MAG: hypothetical protein COT89_01425 [Candidatus Colwellbacteria bacterium CG10_big_fil_rev_8_21_14_0_10_42_22]|uniref:Fimbrial assembly protein n=1 Tax=Candidatus Colwellbacteria bacterium CG10_big_fil_rev_8_21_14_0_10_42_22 TaxID=1974540 RepID=A0A2H0VIE1_9BACT|nr:MAG: hypothetical protein COT89_01425 [Candidatus Colwellbacteria bacterium CG10_big_fil_rev_8_21_14_0_10_42_22]